ncbi:MAG: glycosyltransferase [Saprospiraceae bacterium]
MRLVIFNPYHFPIVNPRSIRIQNLVNEISNVIDYIYICNPILNEDINSRDNVRIHGMSLNNDLSSSKHKKSWIFNLVRRLIWPDLFVFNSFFHFFIYIFKYRKRGDIILTISNPISTHLIGLLCKLFNFNQCYWIADIGDRFEAHSNSKWKKYLSNKFEKLVCYKADYIIVNASSLKDYLCINFKNIEQKVRVIPNGSNVNFSNAKSNLGDSLIIGYFGNTYLPIRPACKELEILNNLAASLKLKGMNIEINLIGRQYNFLIDNYSQCEFVHFKDQVSSSELLKEYCRTNILVSFANMEYEGMPSKLHEYRLSGLPIVYFSFSETDPGSLFLESYPCIFNYYLNKNSESELKDFILKHYKQGLNQSNANQASQGGSWNKFLEELNT